METLLCQEVSHRRCTDPVQHDQTKHLEVDRHFIEEKLEDGLICTPYIPTKGQLADTPTKA